MADQRLTGPSRDAAVGERPDATLPLPNALAHVVPGPPWRSPSSR